MPRQNRVTPFGEIIATPARGTFIGNRGILHDSDSRIVRPWKTKAWIICLLQFKERKRTVMTPGTYTELFFLDEATALAAGHRPCGECRYADYKCFKSLWIQANRALLESSDPKIQEIDKIVHQERLAPNGSKILFQADLGRLPDGVFVKLPNSEKPYLVLDEYLYPWTPSGYPSKTPRPSGVVRVITPRSFVNTLALRYVPAIHPSAESHNSPTQKPITSTVPQFQ